MCRSMIPLIKSWRFNCGRVLKLLHNDSSKDVLKISSSSFYPHVPQKIFATISLLFSFKELFLDFIRRFLKNFFPKNYPNKFTPRVP